MGDLQKNGTPDGQASLPKEQTEKGSRRISPSVLRIMVVFYILWVVKELVLGILKKKQTRPPFGF